jgi:hypothetical protein
MGVPSEVGPRGKSLVHWVGSSEMIDTPLTGMGYLHTHTHRERVVTDKILDILHSSFLSCHVTSLSFYVILPCDAIYHYHLAIRQCHDHLLGPPERLIKIDFF